MTINDSAFPISLPFENPFGDPVGGGGDNATNTDTGGTTSAPASDAVAEPSVIDVDDNSVIRIKGSDKPVKLSEYRQGFQSQFTRASQEAARLKQENARYAAQVKEHEARQRQFEAQRQQQNQGGQDVYAALEQLPYLSGKEAADVVRGMAQEFQRRDQGLLILGQEIKRLRDIVGTLNETHTNTSFDAKIAKFVQDQGLDQDWNGDAAKLYLSYEPSPELDAEFPQILAEFVSSMEKRFEAKRQAAVESARRARQPFIPGRGGQASPSKPLQFKPDASPAEIAEALFPGFASNGT